MNLPFGTSIMRWRGRDASSNIIRDGSRKRFIPGKSRASPDCGGRRQSRWPAVSISTEDYGRWEVHEYLKAGAVSVVQADPEWCGGLSELIKISAVSTLFDAQVIPHGHGIHAALHFVASQPPMTCPWIEYLINKMSSYYHFEKHGYAVVKCRVALPGRPGSGIELDPGKVETRTLV